MLPNGIFQIFVYSYLSVINEVTESYKWKVSYFILY